MSDTPAGPTRFGKYELLSRLAKGGMAETFRAQFTGEAGVTKQVVIKRVLPTLADDESFISAFIDEAKLSASLSHGNIAQVFDFGKEQGDYFIAMELVDGRSLADVLDRAEERGFKRLPEPIACFLTIEVLKGLHYAHTHAGADGRPLGIVHRDISPENILVSFEGQTKVVDFGVAKASQAGRNETAPGTVKGKFLHLSPEQALGRPLDGRSDVFAVGILLYRMLCGVLPFMGQMHVAMHAIAAGRFRPASEETPDLPAELSAVVAKSLATSRDLRFGSALEMQDALASILYRREPTFSTAMIQEWMHWLFLDDLVAEGRRAQVSPRFEAQLEKWSPGVRPSTIIVASQASPAVTSLVQKPASSERGLSGTMMSPLRRRRGILMAGLGGVGVLVAAAIGAWVLDRAEPEPVAVAPVREARAPPPPVKAIEKLPAAQDVAVRQVPEPPVDPVQPPAPELEALTPVPPAPSDPKAAELLAEAKALSLEKLYGPAAAKLDQCLKLAPTNADCHRLRGNIWARQGQLEKGAREYREFLKYAPPGHPDLEQVNGVLKALDAQK